MAVPRAEHILIVGDDGDLLEVLKYVLEDAGYRVSVAESGGEALSIVIRYDIGDRVTLRVDRCACGSALPMLDVQGRCDDTLQFDSHSGRAVQILPLALSTVLEDDAGLFDFQVVQQGPGELSLSTGARGAAATDALRKARGVLGTFLKSQGAATVRIGCHTGRPPRRGRSGKVQRIVAPPV